MKPLRHILAAVLALSTAAHAQTISGVPPIPAPVAPSDQLFIFRGGAPAYSTTVQTLLSGLTTGVFGPATSTTGFVPVWNNNAGNSLAAGLPVSATPSANTIVETNSSGLIPTSILPNSVSLLGNAVTGSGLVVLQSNPTINNLTVNSSGLAIQGATSGSVRFVTPATASGILTVPSKTGTLITSADIGTVTPAMLSATTGSGSIVLSNGPTLNSPVITGGLKFAVLPTGTPASYACFDAGGKLVSYPFPC